MVKNISKNEYQKRIDNLINATNSKSDFLEVIESFELESKKINIEEQNEYRLQFYRSLLEKITDLIELEDYIKITDKIKEIYNKEEIHFEGYLINMDIHVLTGIKSYFENKIDYAKNNFSTAIKIGENYKEYSKKDFYNALNCAYSWLGTIKFNEKKIENAYNLFCKAMKNYNEVKDDENYHVKETEVINICQNYIKFIDNLKN